MMSIVASEFGLSPSERRHLDASRQRYQLWFTGSKDSWTAFFNNQKTHNNSRIHQLVTNRFSYDSKLIYYQQQIRKNITNSFQNKTERERTELTKNKQQQRTEFNDIYQNILSDARRKHPPEHVETNVQQLYENNGIGKECRYTSKHMERKKQPKAPSVLSWLSNKLFSKDDSENEEKQFLLQSVSHVENLLTSVKRYSDDVVQEAINYTRRQLKECNRNRKNIQEIAHQMVYALLVEQLIEKQNQWERSHSISVRLNYAENDLWNFYCNTIKGIVGIQLLTSDLQLILLKNNRAGLMQKIIKYIVQNLQSETWVKYSQVLMARVDLDLLKQIEDGKKNEMIRNVTNSSAHYQKIVNQLIEQKVTACVQSQLTEYHDSLKSAFNASIVKTEHWRNPICDQNEKNNSKINQGRTRFFLQELIDNLNSYKLPVLYADAVRALNSATYSRCDDEPIDIWQEMAKNLFGASSPEKSSAAELTPNERKFILQNTLNEMINNQKNEAVKMRCSTPCPLCAMPCKRASGHTGSLDENERRHDCDHQSGGLGGYHWIEASAAYYRELCYQSCSNQVAAGNRFRKDGVFYPCSDFDKHYPWLTPRATIEAMHEVRQYIFYNYQEDLAAFYNLLPCSNIPMSFNHDRLTLHANLNQIIIQNN